MAARNTGVEFDESWIRNVSVNLPAVKRRADAIGASRGVKKQWQAAWQLRAVTCIDLTTLAGDDTPANVSRLCYKAAHPVRSDLMTAMGLQPKEVTTGAVCVYPSRVADCKRAMDAMKCHLPIASVATGFPTGQTGLKTRLEEIRQAVQDGASEIDIVINRTLALQGDWKGVYEEVRLMREACGEAHLKTILATGELGSLANVYRASMVCMMAGGLGHHVVMTVGKNYLGKGHHFFFDNFFTSVTLAADLLAQKTYSCGTIRMNRKGWPDDFKMRKTGNNKSKKMQRGEVKFRQSGCMVATLWQDKRTIAVLSTNADPVTGEATRQTGRGADFIKTSTGKEAVNATLPVSLVMVRAIRDYLHRTHFKVGFKPAGGIRTAKEACQWLVLMMEELGEEWTRPALFRIGASSLLADLERQIFHYVKGSYPAAHEFPMS